MRIWGKPFNGLFLIITDEAIYGAIQSIRTKIKNMLNPFQTAFVSYWLDYPHRGISNYNVFSEVF